MGVEMTYAEFFTCIITHYGPYQSELSEDITIDYVRNKFTEAELPHVFKRLVLSHTNKFKTPPDPAVFEELFIHDTKRAMIAWDLLKNVSGTVPAIIADKVAHHTIINGWASLYEFTQDRDNNNHWCRKKFIDIYRQYLNDDLVEPWPLDGELYRIKDRKAQMIGDKEICTALLEQSMKSNNLISQFNIGGCK